MILLRCAECGNPADNSLDETARFSCRVCGAELPVEKAEINNNKDLKTGCPVCGNPLRLKDGEFFKCAVCGCETKVKDSNAEKDGEDSRKENAPAAPTVAAQAVLTQCAKPIAQPNSTAEQNSATIEKPKQSGNIAAYILPAKDGKKDSNRVEPVKTSAKSLFPNIFILPAPLGKSRVENPSIRIELGKSEEQKIILDAPFFSDDKAQRSGLKIFDALPFYQNAACSVQEAFLSFKSENMAKLYGIRILPYQLEEDLELIYELGCDIVEIAFNTKMPAGITDIDAAKTVSKARGVINRRGYDMDLLARNAANSAQDIVIALCLGADAVTFDANSPLSAMPPDEIAKGLKEYCSLCAHDKIAEFERRDLIIK